MYILLVTPVFCGSSFNVFYFHHEMEKAFRFGLIIMTDFFIKVGQESFPEHVGMPLAIPKQQPILLND